MAAEPAPVLGAAASAAVDRFPRATRIAGAVGAALRELGLSKHESASASASLLEFTKELFLVLAIIGKRIFLDFRRPATGHANLVSGVGSAEMDRSSG